MADTQIRIPDRHIAGFDVLSSLSEEKKRAFLKAIANVEIGEHREEIANSLSEPTGISRDDLMSLISALGGLLSVKDEISDKVEIFVKDIVNSYARQTKKDIDVTKLEEFITAFLDASPNFRITQKANQLFFERDKLGSRFRIITDVRPLFDDKDGNILQGSIILHNLRIDYFEHTKPKQITLAIDEDDLDNLKYQIQRALDKANSLKKALQNTELKSFDLK